MPCLEFLVHQSRLATVEFSSTAVRNREIVDLSVFLRGMIPTGFKIDERDGKLDELGKAIHAWSRGQNEPAVVKLPIYLAAGSNPECPSCAGVREKYTLAMRQRADALEQYEQARRAAGTARDEQARAEQRAAAAEEQSQRLSDEFGGLRHKVAQQAEQIHDLEDERDNLQTTLGAERGRARDLEQQHEQAAHERDRASLDLVDAEARRAVLEGAMKQARDALAALVGQLKTEDYVLEPLPEGQVVKPVQAHAERDVAGVLSRIEAIARTLEQELEPPDGVVI